MAKYLPYSRRVLRQRLRRWLRSHLGLVTGVVTLWAVLTAVGTVSVVVLMPSAPVMGWIVGAFQAGMVAALWHLLHSLFLAYDGEAIWHLRGAWGEENTRSELQRAKRKRLIWGWVDSITLQQGDLDHLVVTRRGGLVAVDSKWRYDTRDKADMAVAANKARLRAEGVARTILASGRGSHRARVNAVAVTPVVVLWGKAQHDVPDGANVAGIEFVGGRRFLRWLENLEADVIDRHAATDVLKRLEQYRAETWEATTASRTERTQSEL